MKIEIARQMRIKIAKQHFEAWARGTEVSEELLRRAMDELGRPNEFVEDCIKRRFALNGMPTPEFAPPKLACGFSRMGDRYRTCALTLCTCAPEFCPRLAPKEIIDRLHPAKGVD